MNTVGFKRFYYNRGFKDTKSLTITDSRILSQRGVNMAENLTVTITMKDGGVMKGELYPDIAPITVSGYRSDYG